MHFKHTANLWVCLPFRFVSRFTIPPRGIPYSGKLSREKTFANWWKKEKTFADCSRLPRQRTPSPKISRRKLSRIATKPRNSCESFLLRKFNFPLYGSRDGLIDTQKQLPHHWVSHQLADYSCLVPQSTMIISAENTTSGKWGKHSYDVELAFWASLSDLRFLIFALWLERRVLRCVHFSAIQCQEVISIYAHIKLNSVHWIHDVRRSISIRS